MENKEDILYIDFVRSLRVLLSKFWIVVLACLVCGGAMFAYAHYYIAPTYQSSALFYVNNSDISVGSTSVKVSSSDLSASQSLVDTYIVILKTRNTLETVISKGGLKYSYGELYSMISASAVNGTEVFKVTVTNNSAEEAYKIANAIAKVFPDKISEIVTGSGAKVVDYAVINNNPVGPNVKKYALIGALIGAVMSAAAIILIDIFDDTIKDESHLLDIYSDVPVLAVIPNLDAGSKNAYSNDYAYFDDKNKNKKAVNKGDTLMCGAMHFDGKEAFKLLRTNINFCIPDSKCRKIGITSPVRGEGKSTISVNLAYTLAQTGAKVLLIDMDMRLPSIAKKLNFEQGLGLSDVLIGTAELASCIIPSSKYPNWEIISSGSIPPVPSELLGSGNMRNLMKVLETRYNYIICDLPPVNVVSDASVVKELLDGFVITVRENYSDKRSLSDCMRQLTLIEANNLGFVLNNGNSTNGYGKNYSKYYRKSKKYGKYKHYYGEYYKKDKE